MYWIFQFALRLFRKSPEFTSLAVLALSLGIGATTAVFSLVQGVLLRPLPFPEPTQLVVLSDLLEGSTLGVNGEGAVTGPDILAYTQDTHSFESLGGYTDTSYELSGMNEPAAVNAARLTAGVFPALKVSPLFGRVFTQKEDDEHEQVAVLSYAMWQSRFHGDPQVLGRKILLDRKPYLVIGVMPKEFEFPLFPGQGNLSELWVPMSFMQEEISGSAAGSWNFEVVGRLKPGISPNQANLEAERILRETIRTHSSILSSLHIRTAVRPLQEITVQRARPLIRTLFLAVIVVLLIACVNVAGLLLIRGVHSRREIALRLTLGARPLILLTQPLTESLVISITGGLVGLGLAAIALQYGKSLLPQTLPLIDQIRLDWHVAVFAFLLAVFTGVICAFAPALAAMRTTPNVALKEGGRTGTAGVGHARLRSALVALEIAVAMVLLIASGLLLRSFQRMRAVDLGFRPDHALVAAYSLPKNQYSTQSSVDKFNQELLIQLRSLPGVAHVGITTLIPAADMDSTASFVVDGYTPPKDSGMNLAWPSQVMGDYFPAMGIAVLRGRIFTDADQANTQLVAIVNRKAAEHYWPGQDPIGRKIRWGLTNSPTPWMTIIGEVGDVKQGAADQETREQIYQPTTQMVLSYGSLVPASTTMLAGDWGRIVLHTTLAPEKMQDALTGTVRSIDPQLPLTQIQTMEQMVISSETPRRFNTGFIAAFAAIAVLLAILGIYNITAFSVALRMQEVAIRLALGSQRTGILRMVLMSGVKLAAIGGALGLLGAFMVSPLLRAFLFGVSPFDPLVLTLVAISVLLLAAIISFPAALRAASVDPMEALRAE